MMIGVLGISSTVAVLCSAKATAAGSGADSESLSEIVVTATKRNSTVQETPISLTAVSGEELADRGITSFVDLAQSVPGISMRTSGSGQTEFEMRGLQSSGGSSSTVGFYLDETALSSPASAQNGKVVIDPNLYDLEHVEVLRGPQGTLYGSGSMGGTVRLVTHAPVLGAFDASGETVVSDTASGGGINITQNGMINLPLGDTLAVRAVGGVTQTSGWVHRIVIQDGQFPNEYLNNGVLTRGNVAAAPEAANYSGSNSSTVDSARISALWTPAEQLSITAGLMYQDTNQAGPSATDSVGLQPVVSGPEAHYEPYDTPEPFYDRFTLASLKLDYKFDGFTLTSATANWNRHSFIIQDAAEQNETTQAGFGNVPPLGTAPSAGGYDPVDGGLGPNINSYERDYTQQFSEELRILSTNDSPFQWLGGFFYSKLASTWDFGSVQPYALPSTLISLFGVDNSTFGIVTSAATIKQNAFFGEASYKFESGLKATLGLRRYSFTTTQSDDDGGAEFGGTSGQQITFINAFNSSASGVLPKFNISYDIDPELMIYATAAKGFRPGGVNQYLPTTGSGFATVIESVLQSKTYASGTGPYISSPQTFAADSVWNYEVGEKAEFLNRRVTLNADVFYENWINPQLLTDVAGAGYTVNGSNAHIYGLEAEFKAGITSSLTFGTNVGYDHATFTKDNAASGFLGGMAMPDTPKVTSAQTLTYKAPLGNEMTLIGLLENDYVGNRIDVPYGLGLSIYNGTTQSELVHLSAYDLTNLRVGLETKSWTTYLFVNNVANKKVLLDPQPQINIALISYQRYTVNQPLTVGIDFNYRFGGK
jgi:iron complex outermembrane receptor protein